MEQCCVYSTDKYIAMLRTSIGTGMVLVLLEANIIGYWVLGNVLGIVLTLNTYYYFLHKTQSCFPLSV